MKASGVRRPLLALVALVVALIVGYTARGLGSGTDTSSAGAPAGRSSGPTSPATAAGHGTPLSGLPPQAASTLALVRRGGPFPYPHNDGVTFYNDEHRLPVEPAGYYREYTVATPGSADRGARRLVIGRDGRIWYTGDHYESFALVDPGR